MMTTTKDEWVRAAMTDDMVVVDLLVRLKKAHGAAKPLVVIPIRWGLRLPRSRPATVSSTRSDVASKRKEGDSFRRCSPTTPLSWSGAGSPSATADGFEETSRHTNRSPSGVRSKVNTNSLAVSSTIKRSRKKKTFAELKEEVSSLLKEKMQLKKELCTMRETFKEQSARNENLKKLKLHLKSSSTLHETICCHTSPDRDTSSFNHIPSILSTRGQPDDHSLLQQSSEKDEAVSIHDAHFLLPDLNMTLCGEDFAMGTSS
ncbi:hypothetical protein K2173_009380 [Erythroxylum novogranatense]|uniref:Uncharacterized protein n=1 Tax=Erythroxylum novogranatense TaxID=1862640 RepID=A0AAV8U6Z5_9ROSI|nr:hypothetical protein K2173_009380 [Erythroxylum novogranatense]